MGVGPGNGLLRLFAVRLAIYATIGGTPEWSWSEPSQQQLRDGVVAGAEFSLTAFWGICLGGFLMIFPRTTSTTPLDCIH